MAEWIADNAVTIIAIAVLLVVIGIAVFSLVRDKKRKSCGCSGNCAVCGMGSSCCEKRK